jgi:hypothetical protein
MYTMNDPCACDADLIFNIDVSFKIIMDLIKDHHIYVFLTESNHRFLVKIQLPLFRDFVICTAFFVSVMVNFVCIYVVKSI